MAQKTTPGSDKGAKTPAVVRASDRTMEPVPPAAPQQPVRH